MALSLQFRSRNRLYLGFGIIFLAILALVYETYQGLNKIIASQDVTISSLNQTRNFTQLRSDENRLRALALELIIVKDKTKREKIQDEIKSRVALVETRVSEIEKGLSSLEIDTIYFFKIKELMVTYRQNRVKQLALVESGKVEEAMAFSIEVQEPLYSQIRAGILDLEKTLESKVSVIRSQNQKLFQTVLNYLLVMGFVISLSSLLLMLWITGMLRRIFGEIKESVTVLGTAAAEILTTVTEVSTGATETATAVSETTVTIEEIRQTSMIASQKSQGILENSHRAMEAAENGREVIQQTIDGMELIGDHMQMISESITRLSEQSRSIGEITASVIDIADQSNLLAVNAAIEAAKAGEQGRGFTVVAQEIRSLAEQSKRATSQVKDVLNEIQKGMNLAVQAAERGAKVVENGNVLAAKSGKVIDVLSETVNEAAQSVIQISASGQQQMAGMDQIVPAMENIKQASEQNVVGTRQTQAAAHNLNELGQKLTEVINKYQF